jgi:DNA-directed RNA polymerase subunit M/transcription elongation factor TFIIS
MDREKVIKGIHQHCEGSMFDRCGECPYYEIDHEPFVCRDMLLNDLKELLKEQEAVTVHDPGAYCPKCGWMLYPEDHPHHCGNCGQVVKWE